MNNVRRTRRRISGWDISSVLTLLGCVISKILVQSAQPAKGGVDSYSTCIVCS